MSDNTSPQQKSSQRAGGREVSLDERFYNLTDEQRNSSNSRQGAQGTYRSAEVQAEVYTYSITPLNPYPLR